MELCNVSLRLNLIQLRITEEGIWKVIQKPAMNIKEGLPVDLGEYRGNQQ